MVAPSWQKDNNWLKRKTIALYKKSLFARTFSIDLTGKISFTELGLSEQRRSVTAKPAAGKERSAATGMIPSQTACKHGLLFCT